MAFIPSPSLPDVDPSDASRRAPWRLRTRLALALLLVFGPISILVVLSHLENLSERRESRVESLETISETVAATVDGFTSDLDSFSLSTAITLGEAGPNTNVQYTQSVLGSYLDHLVQSYGGTLRSIFLTDLDGRVVASSGGDNTGFDLSGRSYIQALKNGADSTWSGALSGLQTGQITLAQARVVRTLDGTPRNYLVTALYPAQLAERLQVDLPPGATISLVDENGLLLYTTKVFGETDPQPDFATWPPFQEARDGQSVLIKDAPTPLHQDNRYGAYVPVSRLGWVVGLSVPTSTVDGPLASRFRRDLLVIGAVLLIGFIVMVAIAERLSQPLTDLATAAAAIARGERPAFSVEAPDADVRKLQTAMETMTQAISDREERLRSQARVLQTLGRVTDALASELDFGRAVSSLTQAAIDLTAADQAGLFLHKEGSDSFDLTSSAGNFPGFPLAADDPLLAPLWSGQAISLPDIAALPGPAQPRPFTPSSDVHVRSIIGAPIVSRTGLVEGALIVLDSHPQAFNEYAELQAIGLTRRASIVIENARLFSQSQEAQTRLQEANQAKDEFLALISHELRTPITTIYGGARLLQSRGDSLPKEATEEMISSLEAESERLYRLVEDLLAIARADLGQVPTLEPISVLQLVEQEVRQFSRRRPGRPIEITVESQPQPVLAESTYLRQILHNLLSNADKYSDAGLPIDIQISGDAAETIFRVLDRGPGVPPNELDSIFDRFFRSETTARQAGGKGLGLTVCKRLTEAMAGRIWAAQREGGGLVVGVAIPVIAELEDANLEDASPQAAPAR